MMQFLGYFLVFIFLMSFGGFFVFLNFLSFFFDILMGFSEQQRIFLLWYMKQVLFFRNMKVIFFCGLLKMQLDLFFLIEYIFIYYYFIFGDVYSFFWVELFNLFFFFDFFYDFYVFNFCEGVLFVFIFFDGFYYVLYCQEGDVDVCEGFYFNVGFVVGFDFVGGFYVVVFKFKGYVNICEW